MGKMDTIYDIDDTKYKYKKVPSLYNFKKKNVALRHYVFQMLDRTQKLFKYENLPETIPQAYLEQYLQMNGSCAIFKHEGKLYADTGGLSGYPNPYYFATQYIVANPGLNMSKTFDIGKDCVVIRNDWYMEGLLPMCERYATLLVENDITLRLITINSRKTNIMIGKTDAQKESIELFQKRIADGEECASISEGMASSITVAPYADYDTHITKFIELQQYIKGNFFNELGLQASFNMKREAISASEAALNNDTLVPFVDQMLEERKKGVDEVNKVFDTNISVDFDSVWKTQMEERELELEVIKSDIEGNNEEVQSTEPKEGEDDATS